MTMTMPCTQVENSRPGWERFWTYDFKLTCFPNTFPASSKCTTVISSGLRNSSCWRLNSNYTWTTCSKVGSSAWNSKKERQEGMSETNMSNKSPFGSASHFANIGSWKAGSPISNPLLLKAQSGQVFVGLQTTAPWSDPLLLCIWQVFSAAATKGWAWCNRDLSRAGGAYCRSQEAQASGMSREWMLGIPRGMAGKDSLNKYVQQISFRQCVTFYEHRNIGSWKAGSPTSNQRKLKA